jgi:hypothetical protein
MANTQLTEVTLVDGRKAKIHKDEVPILEKLGKLMKSKKEDKSLKNEPENKFGENESKVMTTKKNIKK